MTPKGGGWAYFRELWYFTWKYAHLTHSLALVICACSDSAMPLLSCACLCTNSKWCLPSFVSPSYCTVLLLHCFLLNITACLQHNWVGVLSREEHPLQQLHSKKGDGCIFEGGLIFWEVTVHSTTCTSIRPIARIFRRGVTYMGV